MSLTYTDRYGNTMNIGVIPENSEVILRFNHVGELSLSQTYLGPAVADFPTDTDTGVEITPGITRASSPNPSTIDSRPLAQDGTRHMVPDYNSGPSRESPVEVPSSPPSSPTATSKVGGSQWTPDNSTEDNSPTALAPNGQVFGVVFDDANPRGRASGGFEWDPERMVGIYDGSRSRRTRPGRDASVANNSQTTGTQTDVLTVEPAPDQVIATERSTAATADGLHDYDLFDDKPVTLTLGKSVVIGEKGKATRHDAAINLEFRANVRVEGLVDFFGPITLSSGAYIDLSEASPESCFRGQVDISRGAYVKAKMGTEPFESKCPEDIYWVE